MGGGLGEEVLLYLALQEGSECSLQWAPDGAHQGDRSLPSCKMFGSALVLAQGPGLLEHQPPELWSLPSALPQLGSPWRFCPGMLKLCPALWVLCLSQPERPGPGDHRVLGRGQGHSGDPSVLCGWGGRAVLGANGSEEGQVVPEGGNGGLSPKRGVL